ncbi:MAG: hypothetical protein Q9210_004696, partial [Variospora velana]
MKQQKPTICGARISARVENKKEGRNSRSFTGIIPIPSPPNQQDSQTPQPFHPHLPHPNQPPHNPLALHGKMSNPNSNNQQKQISADDRRAINLGLCEKGNAKILTDAGRAAQKARYVGS